MTDHRPVLSPDVLLRLATNMETIHTAWQADVESLRTAQDELEKTKRVLDTTADRASTLQSDLVAARLECAALQQRNAFLEAQLQRIYDASLDARDHLSSLAGQVVEVARQSPPLAAAPSNQPPSNKPAPASEVPSHVAVDSEEDDEIPAFLSAPHPAVDYRTVPPSNQFARQI